MYLRCLMPSDVNESYIESLNNEQKYLESKDRLVTTESQKQYISTINCSECCLIFGLFRRDELIATTGCQTVSGVEFTVGVFVFDKWRGQGFGKVLIWMACTLLNQVLNVVEFRAGMKIDNQPSLICFLSCGFSIIEANVTDYKVLLSISNLKKPESLIQINRNQER